MILAGDVGGTKTLLGLYEKDGTMLIEKKRERYSSGDFNSIEEIIQTFITEENVNIEAAVLGVPGAVFNGKAQLTNLNWNVEEGKIKTFLSIDNVRLLNDLGATAFSIPYLSSDEILQIKAGNNNLFAERYSVLAPGTGLGEAFLLCEDDKSIVLSSEGGHSDFAPTNKVENELNVYLREMFGRVSYERIISGNGLLNIFEFLVEHGYGEISDETFERMLIEDKGAVITDLAVKKKEKLCEYTLEIFLSVLGAHAGNIVLTNLTTGGVYLGGGIPYKIRELLKSNAFLNSFTNKGRLKPLLEATPIYLINNNEAALKGAAWYAFSLINK